PVTLRPGPSRIFIVFRVLHFFQKPAARPHLFTDAAAGHAEEMVPARRLAIATETPLVIARINGLAVGAWDLSPERRRRLRIEQGHHERTQPIGALRS